MANDLVPVAGQRVNNIGAVVDRFVNQMGSGTGALDSLATLMEDAINTGDTNPLVSAKKRLDKKGDKYGGSAIVYAMGKAFPGFKTAKTKHGVVFKIRECPRDHDAVRGLRKAASEGLSIRAATWKSYMVDDTDKDDKPREPITKDSAKKRELTYLKSRGGVTANEINAMIAALEEIKKDLAK